MWTRSLNRGLLLVLSLLAVLSCPLPALADGEVILHISDTHVTGTSAGNLPAFVDNANRVADGVTLVAHSGDATNDPTSSAYFDTLWAQMNRLTAPSLVVPGNHDLTGTQPGATWTFPRYVQAAAGEYVVIGYSAYSTDWTLLEGMLREAALGGKKIILMEHMPLMIPSWLTSCAGSPCTAPKWLLDSASTTKLRTLIARYDVAALLVGHLHAQYQMRDAALLYDHIASANLGSPAAAGRNYNTVIVDGGNFVAQMTRYNELPIAITSPVYYEAASKVGQITENAPIRVRIVGAAEAVRVSSVTITQPAALVATQVALGVWEANYDWKLLAGRGYNKVSAEVRYTDGVKRSLTLPIQVVSSYPNPAPTVAISVADPTGTGLPVTVSVGDNAAELKQADLYVGGALVRSWSLTSKSAATLTWSWNQAVNPGTWLKVRVVDVFGRKRYAFYGESAPQTTATPTATPTAVLETQTPTPTATATSTVPPGSEGCTPGQVTLSPALDTYISKYAANAEDANPSGAGVLKTSGYSPFYRSLLHFDLSTVPAGSQIASAKLLLVTKSWYYPDGIKPTLSLARLGKAFDNSASWTQAASGSLWTQAGAAAAGSDYLTPTVEQQLVWGRNVVDITALAREWVAAPDSSHDLRLSVVNASHSTSFYATEATQDRPSLTIEFSCPGMAVSAGVPTPTETGVPTTTPTGVPTATPEPTVTPSPTGTQTPSPQDTPTPGPVETPEPPAVQDSAEEQGASQ